MSITHDRFAYAAKIVLYVLAGLLPLGFLPLGGLGVELGREMIFGVLILASAMLWLVGTLSGGELRWVHSPVLYAAGILLVVFGVSAILSKAPMVSFLYADAGAEKLATLVLGVILAGVAGSVVRQRGEAGALIFIMIFSGAAAAALTLLSLFGFIGPIGPVGEIFNVVGTVNGLALFYAALFMMTLGLILSSGFGQWRLWVRWALGAAGALFLADIFLINFYSAWIALLGAGVFLFGLLVLEISKFRYLDISSGAKPRFGWRQWGALAAVALAVVMLMLQQSIPRWFNFPAEVSPSLSSTMSMAGSVFKEGSLKVFFGSGPGTFGLDWARYKDPSINQTIFWGVRFTQGQSWIATALPTAGILGFAALVGFLAVSLFVFLRAMLLGISKFRNSEMSGNDPLAAGAFLGVASLIIAFFLYPANLSLVILFFLGLGILSVLTARPAPEQIQEGDEMSQYQNAEISNFWDAEERVMRFNTPWQVFASSLIIIFLLALGATALYGQANRIRAAIAAGQGAEAFGQGKIDDAIGKFEAAARLEPRNFRHLQALAQMKTEKARTIIQRAAAGENVQAEFQQAVSAAIQDSQRAVALHPQDAIGWRLQGALYELVIPFIQGAERFATTAYQRASELEPSNPAIYVEWGRAGLIFTDRIAALMNQAQGKDREQLEQARKQNLEEIANIFRRAAEAKADFAPAHFLLAQTAIRLGNIEQAIQSAENARAAAPFDTGVAFQLGLLYYQKNDFGRAEQEFGRALTINENYSNARYFLGLIYDRKGDKAKAIAEFERIEALNPDNQEVKRILANLRAGKAALAEIVPPAEAPEKRKETPVKEAEGRK